MEKKKKGLIKGAYLKHCVGWGEVREMSGECSPEIKKPEVRIFPVSLT